MRPAKAEPVADNISEIEDHAAITAQGFLVSALDQAVDELDRFDDTAQRKIPDLAAAVVITHALIYQAERVNDGCAKIADSLNNLAEKLATAIEPATDAASQLPHEDR